MPGLARKLRSTCCAGSKWRSRIAPATEVDEQLRSLGLKVLKTPLRAPQANAYCERLIGTIRREVLDFVIPLGEKHLRRLMRESQMDRRRRKGRANRVRNRRTVRTLAST